MLIEKILKAIYRFLAPNLLAVILLAFLLLLTYLGTREQVDTGLFEVQKKYFESNVLIHYFFDKIPVPLPGVKLLLFLLTLNLILGGIVRLRMRLWKVGILIAHLGIIFLLVGGLISYGFAEHGQLGVLEGETSDVYVSSALWEMAVYENGSDEELIVPEKRLEDAADGETAEFTEKDLPFTLVLSDYQRNCRPLVLAPGTRQTPGQVGDVVLQERPAEKEAGWNRRGVRLTVKEKESGEEHEALLWGASIRPYVISVDGRTWAVELRKVTKHLPFAVRLEKFTRELHPGTSMPKAFRSRVTKIEKGSERGVEISMNEPLRHKGFTLYQSSYQEPDARSQGRFMSIFAVARNPADQLPLYATIVISLGILIHFLIKLVRHLTAETRGRP